MDSLLSSFWELHQVVYAMGEFDLDERKQLPRQLDFSNSLIKERENFSCIRILRYRTKIKEKDTECGLCALKQER